MPLTATDSTVVQYPLAISGVNMHKNIVRLDPDEAISTQNAFWRNGIVKRGGSTLDDSTEVVAGSKVTGVHRFYKADGTRETLAAGGTTVKYGTGSGWSDVKTGLSSELNTNFTTIGWDDSVYFANGTDTPQKWTSGGANSDLSNAPATTVQFLQYRDRVLSIDGGDLTWSDSYSVAGWGSVANIGVRPDTKLNGMILHAVNDGNQGIDSKVLLAGDNGMYLFHGTDLRWPSTTGDYSIFQLGVTAGCNALKTMVWTPKGSIWLGVDRQVYFLPFGSASPIPIGQKIQSFIDGHEGIEKMPAAQIHNACAVYHDGFYKLSFAQSSQFKNNTQFWLDVTRAGQDENSQTGPWYGPMKGQNISCFFVKSGAGDSGELIGGEASAKGYVYELNESSVHGDIDPDTGVAKDIVFSYETFYNPLGLPPVRKDVHRVEFEHKDSSGSMTVDFYDIDGAIKTGDSVTLGSDALYWGVDDYGVCYWTSSPPTRTVIDINPVIQPRALSIKLTNTNKTETFELYGIAVEALEQRLVFD